jgi:hypothetical protein
MPQTGSAAIVVVAALSSELQIIRATSSRRPIASIVSAIRLPVSLTTSMN